MKMTPEYQREWRRNNKERSNAYSRKYSKNLASITRGKIYRSQPEFKRKARADSHRRHIWRTYKLTIEQFAALLIKQAGCCAICDKPMVRPSVDHCHATGKIRGLLCFDCNTGIGKLGDTANHLQKALNYLKRHL